jgi:site-specific DNA recombinase
MSEDREGGGLGIERQREDCEQLAASLGLTVVRVYADNDLSAYSGKPRPDYQHMLDDLRAGTYGTVIAWHTDRLHRRPLELEEYIDVCEPRQIRPAPSRPAPSTSPPPPADGRPASSGPWPASKSSG